jgi:hypothetical protein
MSFKVTVAALAAVCALGAASANAGIIYSNFGPGDAFQNFGWVMAGPDSFTGYAISPGMAFTSFGEADVSEISIGLANIYGDDAADVSIWTRDLATMLGSWHIADLPGGDAPSATKISGISGVHLNEGVEYVLVASASTDGFNAWLWNTTGAVGDYQFNRDGYTSGALGAFEIRSADGGGAVVPEPASWAMMIIGFGGVGATIRRRRIALA